MHLASGGEGTRGEEKRKYLTAAGKTRRALALWLPRATRASPRQGDKSHALQNQIAKQQQAQRVSRICCFGAK